MQTSPDDQEKEDHAMRGVEMWNRSVQVGAELKYLKSDFEGTIILKTVGPAYMFGGEAVVDLEHIGLALLSKCGDVSTNPVRQN